MLIQLSDPDLVPGAEAETEPGAEPEVVAGAEAWVESEVVPEGAGGTFLSATSRLGRIGCLGDTCPVLPRRWTKAGCGLC